MVVGFVGLGSLMFSAAPPPPSTPEARAWIKSALELRDSYWSRGPDARAFMFQIFRAECDRIRTELCEHKLWFITHPDARNVKP